MSSGSSGSSSSNARSTTLVFDECHARIQTVSELLLISCQPRPVFTSIAGGAGPAAENDSFDVIRDRLIGQLNKMLLLSQEVATQAHGKQVHWKQLCHRVKELTAVVVSLLELSAHISYLMTIGVRESEREDGDNDGQGRSSSSTLSSPAVPGPVENVYRLTQADLDIRFSCQRLKRSRINDLQPHLLVELCTALTKSLTVMTEVCRHAAEEIQDTYDQDQFKLCVKAITSTVSCLVTSVKSFKRSPSEPLLRRVVTFCDPVISASAALLAFATEDGFVGKPARLTDSAMEMYKASLGLSVSISSATIQMFRAVRDLVHSSSSSKRHQDRLSLCVESLTRSSGQLRDMLLSHSFIPNPPPPHSSLSFNRDSRNSSVSSRSSHVTSSLSSSSDKGDGGGSSLASTSVSSWERTDFRKGGYHDDEQHSRPLSLSSPRLSSKEGHTKQSHSSSHSSSSSSSMSKTPKSARRDKDNSRSPRTKENRHKSSSSTSSSTPSSSSSSSHPPRLDKDKICDGQPDGRPPDKHKDSNQLGGLESSAVDSQRPSPSPNQQHWISSANQKGMDLAADNIADASIINSSPPKLSSHSPKSPLWPGSRPTSMDVEVALASLANVGPDAEDHSVSERHATTGSDEAGSETLPGLRELRLDERGLANPDGGSDEDESCDL